MCFFYSSTLLHYRIYYTILPAKIKDIFIDSKIPKEQRDFIPIIEFDNSIAWLTGIKVSELIELNVTQLEMDLKSLEK